MGLKRKISSTCLPGAGATPRSGSTCGRPPVALPSPAPPRRPGPRKSSRPLLASGGLGDLLGSRPT
ncbi:hypothetical protein AEQ27_06075 [Frigoribacterium sp. RIT-PI-h]|nr:hypothetical protein AEQ27_06075 [Frigoribacterium sp. RIT-PI-h]